ncbi:MAG: exo-alpha-sialidase [Candidatus Hydrogenedentes bacterium]|nr:exo-alpha-sialidase [Candidatus Hydrogenedentota bacterium]
MAFFLRGADQKQIVVARNSADLGQHWTDEAPVLELSLEPGGWALPEALVDRGGELHLFFLNDAHSGIILTGEENRPKTGSMPRMRLDIWHTRSREGRTRWETPKKIWEGYTGALNSVIQMSSGRILLPFSCLTDRTWGKRGEGLDAFTFRGQYDSTLVYSDDGETWVQPPVRLKVPTPDIVSAYGAVEPVVIQLKDGRVWMLIRTQQGRFYESFSKDGAVWSEAVPSSITSSDSPGGIVRLTDGRLVLFWNNCQRYPYAYGGRQVLHAAISADEGKTWRGYREVARDSLRNEPPPPSGDHGTAYPFPFSLQDGRVVFVTGQGEAARVACKVIDPAWLTETEQFDDLSQGLEAWSVFGTKGVELVPHPDRAERKALLVRNAEGGWPACAVWNFPAGAAGTLLVRIRANEGFQGAAIALTDHFSTPFDLEDVFYNMYTFEAAAGSLEPGIWHELALKWDCTARICTVQLDGQVTTELRQTRESQTPCYLRLRANGNDKTDGGFLVESVRADVTTP